MDKYYKCVIREKNERIDELERELFFERMLTIIFYVGFIILYLKF